MKFDENGQNHFKSMRKNGKIFFETECFRKYDKEALHYKFRMMMQTIEEEVWSIIFWGFRP